MRPFAVLSAPRSLASDKNASSPDLICACFTLPKIFSQRSVIATASDGVPTPAMSFDVTQPLDISGSKSPSAGRSLAGFKFLRIIVHLLLQ